MIEANEKEGTTSYEEKQKASHCVKQNKSRFGLNSALRHVLMSMRFINPAGKGSKYHAVQSVTPDVHQVKHHLGYGYYVNAMKCFATIEGLVQYLYGKHRICQWMLGGSPATPIVAAPKVPSGRELTELNQTSRQVATPLAYATRNLIRSMRNCTSQHAQQPPSIVRCQMHP
ncbi:uncharacterized protein CLUP02_03910 [Colletotrichum lupini]|uniref:Uncharacterized protein n=1 Tax=Colletotrichum lupini TaxID=145971 RepID=A0A9Q8SJQ5_9PEZI|nr:uncharacterized protein CLUP02_03910 [Colletotrichum lupini]UQC78433.1 hypothetical protein CLUP02_03910 [Colletotrichum lupini]